MASCCLQGKVPFEGQPSATPEDGHQHIASPRAHFTPETEGTEPKHRQRKERNLSKGIHMKIHTLPQQTREVSESVRNSFIWDLTIHMMISTQEVVVKLLVFDRLEILFATT